MDWIKTKAGLQMAETIIRYLPRIVACLEEISKNNTNDIESEIGQVVEELEDMSIGASIVKSNEEVEGVFMSSGEIQHIDYVETPENVIPQSDVEYENIDKFVDIDIEREELRCKEK